MTIPHTHVQGISLHVATSLHPKHRLTGITSNVRAMSLSVYRISLWNFIYYVEHYIKQTGHLSMDTRKYYKWIVSIYYWNLFHLVCINHKYIKTWNTAWLFFVIFVYNVFAVTCTHIVNPAGYQEKSSVAYCFYKNHNFTNIGHKNMNDVSF